MFDFFGSGIDGLYKILWLLIIIHLIFTGGFGLLFRMIAKPLKLDISNREVKDVDDNLLDLQLLKLYHGINVTNIDDAELAALAIKRKMLRPQKAWLMLFCPPIGQKKHGTFELAMIVIIFIYCCVAGSMAYSDSRELMYNHASITTDSQKIFISENSIFIQKEKRELSKKECLKLSVESDKIIKKACDYVTTNDPEIKRELKQSIEKNNKNKTINNFTALFFYVIAILLFISYSIYKEINNEFYAFKTAELTRRKKVLYKSIFTNHKSTKMQSEE